MAESVQNYEDGSMPLPSTARIRGGRIVTETTVTLMTPEELFVWETVYQTIVDCHKVATDQWQHFKCMRWHRYPDAILTSARAYVSNWVESQTFADYLWLLGWEPDKALMGIREVLEGQRNKQVDMMLKQIAKERDARRDRS